MKIFQSSIDVSLAQPTFYCYCSIFKGADIGSFFEYTSMCTQYTIQRKKLNTISTNFELVCNSIFNIDPNVAICFLHDLDMFLLLFFHDLVRNCLDPYHFCYSRYKQINRIGSCLT